MNTFLQARLQPALSRQRTLSLALRLGLCWLTAAALGWGAQRAFGDALPAWALPAWTALTLVATLLVVLVWWCEPPDFRALARRIERRHADLDGKLLTAVQVVEEGSPNFLQERLLRQAMQHSLERDWTGAVSRPRLLGARALMVAALVAVLATLAGFRAIHWSDTTAGIEGPSAFPAPPPPGQVDVTPGDVDLEKGSSLVVLARFADEDVPGVVELVTGHTAESERRIPLVKNFNDPVFGGTVPAVTEGFRYRVEYDGHRSREFTVTVFEYPKLERSDVTLTYPAYTKLPPKRITDTRRVSAVEGTTLELALQLNKPVATAVLKPRPQPARNDQRTVAASAGEKPENFPPATAPLPPSISLVVDPAQAQASLTGLVLSESADYDLVLTDAEGRANKTPARFSFDVQPNRAPEIKLTRPRGDQRPSALEELLFTGTAWDDFGVLAYGIALARAGEEPRFLELGRDVPAQDKHSFQHFWRLEDEAAQPDELFAWFTWADDLGPDGQRRRTTGDMFFAEVRPFEEIFRQGEAPSGNESQQQQGGGQAQQAAQLSELQKQIINAAWKLQREMPTPPTDAFRNDTRTVRDAQADALAQAEEAAQESNDARALAGWKTAKEEMSNTLRALDASLTQPPPMPELSTALGAAQRTYQALLKVQAREHEVSRSRNQSGQSQGDQSRQAELDQLELTEEENRYENQRLATPPDNEERREQLQVLNRLQELAQRQEEITERLKEVQAALAEAKTEAEREELQRELKRLQEEQRDLLAGADELNQRLERPENQQSLAQERQQMEEVRENLQQASEAAAEGNVSQAVASGTRAQRQMEEMRDELRQRNSSALNEALRELRAEARDLARRQERLSAALGSDAQDDRMEQTDPSDSSDPFDSPDRSSPPTLKSLGSADDQAPGNAEETGRQLAEQRERTADLVEKATELSAEAEAAEPLVSRQLYDSVRKFAQDDAGGVKQLRDEILREGRMTRGLYDQLQELQEEEPAGKALAATAELLRRHMTEDAARSGQRARAALDELRRGVEGAAENVLGDDTEALKRADRELADLTRQLEREKSEARGEAEPTEAGEETPQTAQAGAPDESESQQGQQQGSQGRQGPPGQDQTQTAQAETPGEGQGQQNQGQSPSQNQSQGQGSGEPQPTLAQSSSSEAGGSPGEGAPSTESAPSDSPGSTESSEQPTPSDRPSRLAGGAQGGGPSTSFGGRGGGRPTSPLTGEEFAPWSDRLRDVEEMLDFPDLRSGVATARERARLLRRDLQRDLKKPDWAVVELEVLRPLVEVRQRLREELARRTSDDALVPIDRDPVPSRYTELVRRYYEELGRDRPR